MALLTSRATGKEFTILMASLMSVVAITIDALLPALGIISEDLQIANRNHAQYLIGFIFIGMALGELVAGPLSDAWGRKKILYIGIGLYFAGSVICYLAPDLNTLLIGRFIQGIGVAGPYISTVSIVRDKHSGRDMARVMSIVMMIFILIPAIAPSLGQAILHIADWRAIFLLYIGYAAAIVLWLFFRLDETLPPENRIPFKLANIIAGFKEIVSSRPTISYMVCMGICFGSFLGYLNSSQQIFQEQFNTGEMFTIYFGVLALVLGAASLMNSRFVEKLGMHYICVRALLSIIGASAVFLAMHWLVEIELWMFLGYAGLLFFAFGLMFGNLNSLAMEPMGHIAGMAAAIIGAVSSIISMSLGAAIGQMYDNTLIPMTIGFLVLGVVSLLIMLYANSKRRIPAS